MSEILEFPTDYNPNIGEVEIKDPGCLTSPKAVLEQAVNFDLNRVVVFGYEKDGTPYLAASAEDPLSVFFDLEIARDIIKDIIKDVMVSQEATNE